MTSREHFDDPGADARSGASGALRLALGLGAAAAVLAGVALWASEGAGVFVQSAFAALAACL